MPGTVPPAQPEASESEFPEPQLSRRKAVGEPESRRGHSGAAWAVVVIALGVAAVVVSRGFAHPKATPAAAPSLPIATATATMTTQARAAAVDQAKTAADNATRAAQDAEAAAQHVADLLASAQAAASRVTTAASLATARQPAAPDPSGGLLPLQQVASQIGQVVTAIESDATAADGAANAAASIAQQVSAAVASGDAASKAAAQANQALTSAQQAAGQISDLLASAQSAVASWQQVHKAPQGRLGITVQDPAPTIGVQGCQVVDVLPGGAAARVGIVGANPVGDVITELADPTDANAIWPTPNCAALQAAMALTRAGDEIGITYLHQEAFVFATQWVRATGRAVLGATATSSAAVGAATGSATASASGAATGSADTGGAATGTATSGTGSASGGAATGTATAPGSGGTATASATASAGGGTATGTATASCPAPVTGTITPASAGSRIAIVITLSGPGGTAPNLRAILDTGGVATSFPDGLLRQLGYQPYGTTQNQGVVPNATATANLYHVPGSALTVLDGSSQAPLATGVLTVIGIPGGSNYTLGPDILEGGSRLSTFGSQWSLTPPC